MVEQNFQPQVRDTTDGPNLHTYIPRADGAIMVGGVAYYPGTAAQASGAKAPTVAVVAPVPASLPFMLQPGQTAATMQMQTPIPQQPMMYPMQYIPQPQPVYSPYIIQQQPPVSGLPSFSIQQPAYGTLGLTGTEVLQQQLATAQGLEMNKKQDMKPADDDPNRFYWVRELDNSWSQRNRITIDSGDIGDCRWYAKDGEFYAVRLPS